MINSINIQNFQSHKDTTLEFHSGMNVIVGASDSGKTAIIRAFRLNINNRPGGDSFFSHWGGGTQVSIETDKHTILRKKNSKENCYQLGEDTVFKAVNKDVPEEIQKAFNMDVSNLQQQLDSPFLLSETPGAVALHFNKVAKLDKIDKGLTAVEKVIRKLKQDNVYNAGEIKKKEKDLEAFEDLPEMEKDVEKLENLINKKVRKSEKVITLANLLSKEHTLNYNIVQQQSKLEQEENVNKILLLYEQRRAHKLEQRTLAGFIEDIEDLKEEEKQASKLIGAEQDVEKVLKLYENKEKVSKERTKLKKHIHEISEVEKEIKTIECSVEIEPQINKLIKLYEKRSQTTQDGVKLKKIYLDTTEVAKSLKSTENELKELEQEFEENFPDVCPLCDK